jgi:hypothetical protein
MNLFSMRWPLRPRGCDAASSGRARNRPFSKHSASPWRPEMDAYGHTGSSRLPILDFVPQLHENRSPL